MWRKLGQAALLVGLGILAGAVIIGRIYAKARGGGLLSRVGIDSDTGGESVSDGVGRARKHLAEIRDGGATVERGIAGVELGAAGISSGRDSVARGHGRLVSTNERLRLFIDAHRGRLPSAAETDTSTDTDTGGGGSS